MNGSIFNIQTCANFAISTLLSIGLVACGGDGGGSPTASTTPAAPTTPVAITATNAPTVASVSISGSAPFTGGSVSGSTLGAVSPVALRMLGRFNVNTTKQVQKFLSASQITPTFMQTTACLISGSETLDAANDGTSVTVTYNNCSDSNGEIVNGTMSLTNINSSATGLSATSSVDLVVSTTGYPTVRFIGTYNFVTTNSSTGSTIAMTGTSYSIIIGSNVTTLSNFSFTEIYTAATTTAPALYSTTSNYTLASTELGGSVTVTTVSPLQQYGTRLYPFAGQFVVTGSTNSKIRVTILGDETHVGDDVQIEIDANGDGTYETSLLRDWSAL